MTECGMSNCPNHGNPRPVFDANPDPAARKQIGNITVCTPCQIRIDKLNAKVSR